ncbi:MAG: M55 family metallopeptidase [Herpetosiphonaceae bacterium]|nr:M55 family metallopeptidase [Herpetosiphonaceae bacterium]
MKIYISADIEGVAGIVDWEQCRPSGGAAWQEGRDLLTAEVNAAIEGAFLAGAHSIVVNDAHGAMRTILPRSLDPRVRLIQGRVKTNYMLEGLDRSFDALFMIGYHGAAGARWGVLNHTYSPYETRLNGTTVDEALLNAAVAGVGFDVPVALVSGDEWTIHEVRRTLGAGLIGVATKRSTSRYAAESLHPTEACRMIADGAQQAIPRVSTLIPYLPPGPYTIELDFETSAQADRAALMPSTERVADRTVNYTDSDILTMYRAYQALMILGHSGEV